jgi:hypothetical protein
MTTRIAVTLLAALALAQQIHAQATPPEPPIDLGAPTAPGKPLPAETDGAPVTDGTAPAGCPHDHFWVTADYLVGWTRGDHLPPLVTTSPPGTAQAAAGVLGPSTTAVLFGNSNVDADLRSGFRIGAGGWLDAERTRSIDGGFFMLESRAQLFFASSQGNPILARPFTDATTNTPTSQLIAFPGVGTGSVTASARANDLYGAHVDFQEVMVACAGYRVEALVGFSLLQFTDRLAMETDIVSAGAVGVVPGTIIRTQDRFNTLNSFQGADFGIRAGFSRDRWTADLLVKGAIGYNNRKIGIAGDTMVTVPGVATPSTSTGGFLALSSNSGVFHPGEWTAVPELGLDLGWKITDSLQLRVGYSLLYWFNVARAADQASLLINPNLFPPPQAGATPPNPAFALVKSDMWIQSLRVGFDLRF